MSDENSADQENVLQRLLQPKSMFARLFWFLGLGIMITNGLLLFISYQKDQRTERLTNAYRLGFEIAPEISRFLNQQPLKSNLQGPNLTWQVIDLGGHSRALAIASHGMLGWTEQQISLPIIKEKPGREKTYITVLSQSDISLNSVNLAANRTPGTTALIEKVAHISEQISKSGKRVNLVIDGPNNQVLVFKSDAYWNDEGALSKYDFLLYVVLILFFMGLPYAAGLIFSPLDSLLKTLKEKRNDATPIKADRCHEISEIAFAINHLVAQLSKHMSDRLNFVAAISHDLGVPATRLRLRASMIKDVDVRKRLIEDSNEMSAMIADSLQYLRNETTDEAPRVVDFFSLIQSLHQDYIDTGNEVNFDDTYLVDGQQGKALTYRTVPSMFSGTETEMDYQSLGPLTVTCKPRAMRRAIGNLVDNALKYGDAALLEIDADVSSVVVKVTDRGPGIPEDEMDNVIQPFYRLEKSRGRGTGGTGLGLAIVSTIVKDHDGFLTMENLLQGGLQVTIALPRDNHEAAE